MGRAKSTNTTKVVRLYPDNFNTPQNMGEVKTLINSGDKTPVWKFKPTLTLDMMTSEGIRKILKEQLDTSPEEFYKACRESKGEIASKMKNSLGQKMGIAQTFLRILRYLFTVPRNLSREMSTLINKDSRKYGFDSRQRRTGLSRTETHKVVYDNLEYLIDGIKNSQQRNRRHPTSKITTRLASELELPKVPQKSLMPFLKAIEIYYVDKSLTLAHDYLEALSLYHMGASNRAETMDKMFVGSESIKRELIDIGSYFLIKAIAYKEGFLPTWFFKVRLQPRVSVAFDSERRANLYKNATITALDLRNLYKESVDTWGYAKCAITGDRLFFDYWASQEIKSKTCNISIDRLTEDSQYARGEVQLTTRGANVSKQTMTNSQFDVFCRKVVKHQKETKAKRKEPTATNQLDLYGELDLWPLE